MRFQKSKNPPKMILNPILLNRQSINKLPVFFIQRNSISAKNKLLFISNKIPISHFLQRKMEKNKQTGRYKDDL
jgi:hypothetical protein